MNVCTLAAADALATSAVFIVVAFFLVDYIEALIQKSINGMECDRISIDDNNRLRCEAMLCSVLRPL